MAEFEQVPLGIRGRSAAQGPEPHITVSLRGIQRRITLNRAAFAALGEPVLPCGVIGLADNNGRIALEVCAVGTPGAAKMNRSDSGNSPAFACANLLWRAGIQRGGSVAATIEGNRLVADITALQQLD